jgi:hypothetical protein
MPRPSSWLSTTASTLGGELARLGLTVPTDQLEYLLTDRVAAVAQQMHITERTARRYFDHDTLRTLAHEMALNIKEEAPGADLLTLPRTIAMPLPTLGATIAALVEAAALAVADKDPGEPATAMALISTLGVLTRDHDGDTPNVCRAAAAPHASGPAHREHRRPRTPRLSTTTRRRRGRPTPPAEGTARRRRPAPSTDPRHQAIRRGPVGGPRQPIVNTRDVGRRISAQKRSNRRPTSRPPRKADPDCGSPRAPRNDHTCRVVHQNS